MDLPTPAPRLALLTGGTAVVFVALAVTLESLEPDSGAHGVVAVSGMVVALALVGFAWPVDNRAEMTRPPERAQRQERAGARSDARLWQSPYSKHGACQ
jgi:hypothetical protein